MGRTTGSGRGSIWKTDTGYRGQITLNGHRYSVSGKKQKDVINKLDELKRNYLEDNIYEGKSISVERLATYWLANKVQPNVTDESYIHIESMFKNHIFPVLGNVNIQDLTRSQIEECYAKTFFEKNLDDRKYSIKEYSHSTVNALSAQFKKCLNYAVREHMITKNPHDGVELHKLRPPKKVSSYTSADQERIINYIKYNKECDRVFFFLISTGMRFCEAAGLTWDNVDMKTGKIKINQIAVSNHGSMYIVDRTKTPNGTREIIVGQNILDWLQWHKDSIDQNANWRNLVFPNMRMNIINQSNAIARWKKVCAIVGVEYQGMHALRHTWGTRALEAKIDVKTISVMLGHKNVITTMNIYQDVLDTQKQDCADTMNKLF